MRLSPETIVVALGIFLALWYLGASMFNRRRGVAVFRWLHDGLDALGGDISSRWIGSSGSGAQIRVAKADPPLKDLDVIYLLASRELLPLFLFDLARGKRDRLIVKAGTRAASPAELEAVPANSRLGRQMQAEVDHPWQIEEGPAGLLIGTRGGGADAVRAALLPLLDKYASHIQRVSWSRKAPQLIATLSLANLYEPGGSASGLYTDLIAVLNAAGKGSRE